MFARRILYNVFFVLFGLAYFPYVILKGKWHAGFKMRFGFLPEELFVKRKKGNIWIHAVSVGEVQAVGNLMDLLRKKMPDYRIVISTVTQTGCQLAKKKIKDQDLVIYAPLDFGPIVSRYIKAINPVCYITAETEIWPNLFMSLSQRNIPIVIVNGRISDRSFARYRRLKVFMQDILNCVSAFCMQTENDCHRIIALGAQKEKVHLSGNLKFDDFDVGQQQTLGGFGFRPDSMLWVAGSTHPGEEEIILKVFQSAVKIFPKLKLVLVPRHIERANEVATLVREKNFFPVLFSNLKQQLLNEKEVMVVDQIGLLKSFYSLAHVVFVGKSLVGFGGQNFIEPAFYKKAIIVGPHLENFRAIAELFQKQRAFRQVQNENELSEVLEELLKDERKRIQLGNLAQQVVLAQQGASQKTVKLISKFF